MQFEIDDTGAAAHVILQGRLDGAGAEEIELPFTASLGALGKPVMLDLSAVPFVGSLGIRLLLSVARVVQRKGQRLVIFGAQPAVAEVFETVVLSELVPVADDKAAATALLAA